MINVSASVSGVRRTTVYTYHIEGAPPIQRKHAKTIWIHPDRVTVTFTDGERAGLSVSGPRILKHRLSTDREEEKYYDWDEVPDWLQLFLAEPEVRAVAMMTNFDAARVLNGYALTCDTAHVDTTAERVASRSQTIVRLYTPDELLEAHRRAVKDLPGGVPPMTRQQAEALTRPLPEE